MAGLPIPHITIGELLWIGLPNVAIRCLAKLCKGQAVVRLNSFSEEMRAVEQQDVAWRCMHCGGHQVTVEQPQPQHRQFKVFTFAEMQQAAEESTDAHMPARPIAAGITRILAGGK